MAVDAEHGPLVRLVRLLAVLCLLPGVAGAQSHCRLALLLALDVSSSVDAAEYALQRDGTAAALTAPDVMQAILQGGGGAVALGVYEWSGRRQSSVVLDWTVLRSEADVLAAAERLRGARRSFTRFPTALGYALGYGATMMGRAPQCDRRVIDVSGDGITNDGFGPELAYRHFPFDGVTVNGLAVLGADPDVLDHYEFFLQHGPGAFVETAEGYAGFQRAMERKLYREIEDRVVGGLPGGRGPG
ncbi:DUF1194 domain-containing protein [Tropicibacter oceani]|uniref:DUF1194 domain-containing protein n=1 Tax=Tropicibacter oceani TaxID=3058420 RepID=A0ABY8QLE5_9RHOB|nr:DUF1194 domain-containing protein [Tropicibacter oceani]WGW05437.1 DUF1194 domain-containing protein [Tropicibacter oceani]